MTSFYKNSTIFVPQGEIQLMITPTKLQKTLHLSKLYIISNAHHTGSRTLTEVIDVK
ncbi:hypothetical protein Hanom_Chr14g01282651 [Helianthus anomalus]